MPTLTEKELKPDGKAGRYYTDDEVKRIADFHALAFLIWTRNQPHANYSEASNLVSEFRTSLNKGAV